MKLTFKDFEKMEEIDHQYFPDENISPAQEAYEWYLADPNSCIVVRQNGDVIAYVVILSLKKDIYEKVKFNKINESQIKVEDLELSDGKYFNYLYFSSIAIDKHHRNIRTLKQLLQNTTEHLKKICHKHKLVEVMADCSTKEGIKITQHILKLTPFMKTSHGSTIHILDGNNFLKNFNQQS